MSKWPGGNLPDSFGKPGTGLMSQAFAAQPSAALLQAALQNLPIGALLFDGLQQLVLCNAAARSLMKLPDYLFAHGLPALEQILRFHATRSESRPADVEAQVSERLRRITAREAHFFRLVKPSGKILEFQGTPLEHGGYLITTAEAEKTRNSAAKRPLGERPSQPNQAQHRGQAGSLQPSPESPPAAASPGKAEAPAARIELRQHARMACNIRCRCATPKGSFWGCIVDISRMGLGLSMDPALSLVPGFRITIENGPLVGATGTVSWATWGNCGVRLDTSFTIQKLVDAVIDTIPH